MTTDVVHVKQMYSSYLFGQSDSVVANPVSLGAFIL